MKMIRSLLMVFCLILTSQLSASHPDQQYLLSANSLATGPHSIAFANGLPGSLHNPAGLVYVDGFQFLASFGVTHDQEYIIHSAVAFPLSIYKNISTLIDGAYVKTKNGRIQSGMAVSWRMGIVNAGFYGAYKGRYEGENIRSSVVTRLGFLLSPILVKLGVIIENNTSSTNIDFIIREQLGAKLYDGFLKLSVGAKQSFLEKFSFIPNVAAEIQVVDFATVSASYEDKRVGAGLSLTTYVSKLNFGTSYDIEHPSFDYAVSFDSRF